MEKKIFEHPAYGIITLSRVSIGGDGMRLFGSELKNKTAILLKINKAYLKRDYSIDKAHTKHRDNIVEVYLSPEQFATLITTMNYGDGTPCTLRRVGGESVEQIKNIFDRKKQFDKELSNVNQELINKLKGLHDVIDNLKLSKKKAEDVKRDIHTIQMHLESNFSFIKDQFDEHVENTTTQMKAEVESFVSNVVNNAGLEALQSSTKNLIE